jgi:hypothetical protein
MASAMSDITIMQEEQDINASVVTSSPLDAITPSLAPAIPDIAIMQEEHHTSVSNNTYSPPDVITPLLVPVLQGRSALASDGSATVLADMMVDLIPGQQAHSVKKKLLITSVILAKTTLFL